MIDYLKIPNDDSTILITLFLILGFFTINSFLIGHAAQRHMNTVGTFARFMIGSMGLLTLLLVFIAVVGLFAIDYNAPTIINSNSEMITNGFIVFITIQSVLIIFYLLNWKAFKINFNINIGKWISFIMIFSFLIGMYYGYVLKVITPFALVQGSAFFETLKIITSFSSNYTLENSLEVNHFLTTNGINIYLLLITAVSINSFGHYELKNFYIIFKKIALALLFISIFLVMDGVVDLINYLFVVPFLIALFGFYWDSKEIIVNDGDKNNFLILTMLSIIIFNYWFLLISLILAFLFTIYSIKRATTTSIFTFSKILIYSLLAITLGFSSFQFPSVDLNNTIFITKSFIAFIFLFLFIVSYIAYKIVKRNNQYWKIIYKIEVASTNKFNTIFIISVILEYVILVSLVLTEVLIIIELGSDVSILTTIFPFFNVAYLGIDDFIFFLVLWLLIIILFLGSLVAKRTTRNKYKTHAFFQKLNLENFESNIIFISFIAIIIIFNPLFFPVINIGLTSFLINDGYFELTNLDQKISFLNLIWIIPFLILISRTNEKGFFVIKNHWNLIASESTFTAIMAVFPIYKILTR